MIFWRQFKATQVGSITERVKCESCGAEYEYILTRQAQAQAISLYGLTDEAAASKAKNRAAAKLKQALARGTDPVPCPVCGHYQEHMLWAARRLKYRWLSWYPLIALLVSPLFCLGALLWDFDSANKEVIPMTVLAWLWGGFLVASVIGVPVVIQPYLRRLHDPNKAPVDQRIALGKSRASLAPEVLDEE
jgi:hypothetical protein